MIRNARSGGTGGCRYITVPLGIGVAVASCLVAVPPANAAPDDGFAVSNDASLRGGTAVALGRDAASVWYNPAIAATIERVRIEASVSAYGVRHTVAPEAVVARVGDQRRTQAGKETHVVVVPSSVAFGFGFPRNNLGLVVAVHNERYADIEARSSIRGRNEAGDYDFTQEFNTLALRRRYHFGATLGWEPHPRFRLGFTFGGMFDKNLESTRLVVFSEADTGPARVSAVADLDVATRVVGGEVALGIEGHLGRFVHLGASLRPPSLAVWRSFQGGETATLTRVDQAGVVSTDTLVDRSVGDDPPRWVTPWRIAAGIGLAFDRGVIELDAEASAGQHDGGQVWRERARFNVSLGGSHRVGKRWELGGGVFTDRSTRAPGDVFPDVAVDRWGGSLAARLQTPVRLAESERTDTLVFETTLALRYAAGVGTSGRFVASYPDGGAQDTTIEQGTNPTRAWQHLVAVQLGTALRF